MAEEVLLGRVQGAFPETLRKEGIHEQGKEQQLMFVRCDGLVSWSWPGGDTARTWKLFCTNPHNFPVTEKGVPSMLG